MPTCYIVEPVQLATLIDRPGLAIKTSVIYIVIQGSLGSLSSIVNQLVVFNLSKFSPSLPLSLWTPPLEMGWVYRFAVIKIGSLLRGVVKSAQRLPPSLLARTCVAFVHCSLINTLVRSSTSCLPLSS